MFPPVINAPIHDKFGLPTTPPSLLRALASMAGISHEAVAKVERGELRGPALSKLSAALNIGLEVAQ